MSVNTASNTELFTMDMPPEDEHNARLRAHTHPLDWHNPTPRNPYNLVVIGAGTAGLVTAAGGAAMGARVALIEKHLMGGDCLNYGCVPSKGLIRCATVQADVRDAGAYGIVIPGKSSVDFGVVMERMRRLRADLSAHDSVRRFAGMGVDVFLGEGRFTGPGTVKVGGTSLTFAKAIIATGSRPAVLSVPGLEDTGYMTNETVFNVTGRPARLGVIGGGPIGCELAQTFQRLGSQVVLFHRGAHVLKKEDADAAEIVQQALRRDGVQLLLDTSLLAVEPRGDAKGLRYRNGAGETADVTVDAILVATGRLPNVEDLGLEAAGVAFHPYTGIQVDDRLRTSNPRIFAAGDVCSRYQFTHAADFLARTVLANALFMGRQKASALTIPWCTYTDPQIAHVGITERQAAAQGISLETFMLPLTEVDRAVLDGETEGFARVHVKKGSDTILGATVVARHAGDMIGIYTTAMTHGLGLAALAKVIQPYPTQAEAVRKTADLYNRTRLTTRVKQLMVAWLWWQRRWSGARTS
jgi:pyruvate/2-oxoglutarate dehydrogenase complex dihydrolipoamide dehydrogenase (E3) component